MSRWSRCIGAPMHLSLERPGWWPTKAWTKEEDYKLVAWGCGFEDGHGFVARHDLDRTEQEGIDRIAALRAEHPTWVAQVEADAATTRTRP